MQRLQKLRIGFGFAKDHKVFPVVPQKALTRRQHLTDSFALFLASELLWKRDLFEDVAVIHEVLREEAIDFCSCP